MSEQRRRFSPEFKRDAVALVRQGRPIAEVARSLGVGESNIGYWVAADRKQRAEVDPQAAVVDSAVVEDNKRLRRRVAELEVEREILKRSLVFWVKESNG